MALTGGTTRLAVVRPAGYSTHHGDRGRLLLDGRSQSGRRGSRMTVLAGADAGGSSTVAAVMVEDREVSRVTGTGAAVRPGRTMASGSIIGAIVRDALNRVGLLRAHVLVVGAAGVGREEDRRALRDALRLEDLADTLRVVTDHQIAFEAAFGSAPGILLLAGTGSICVSRGPDGTPGRQGGHGWLVGDDGGGYALGHAALRAASRAVDGRGPPTTLVDQLVRKIRVVDFDGIVRWSVSAGPTEVAALAPVLIDAAEAGDAVAHAIIEAGAVDLAAHVTALGRGWPEDAKPAPVAIGGGLFQATTYRALVAQRLADIPGLALREETIDPVSGALAIARASGT
ncbi:MAG: hypothetical protein E4G90_01250 [Gemmatimonadales bacterium]|nr:MAG: hypothetical protein E4G90_01250 [Gemmatimonadales bacterium]